MTINTWQTALLNGNVRIFELSKTGQIFGKSIQAINAFHPTAVHLTESIHESFTYLWLSDGKNKRLQNRPVTRVYKYVPSSPDEPFKVVQQIWDDHKENILSIDSTIMPDQSLVVFLLTKSGILKMYKKCGVSEFQLMSAFNTRGSNAFIAIATFSHYYGRVNGHHLVLSKSSQDNYEPDSVYILNSKMRGIIY